jgi:beta-glucosidase
LLHRIGNLLGDEGRRKDVHVALAPTVCIQRSPLFGRGFEAFAEDPVLSGTLALHYINGLQERQVGACIKHYAAHDQSAMAAEDDVHMTERTLREIHLMPFQIAMKSQPWAFMASYNRINGLHVSESPFMLAQVLRKEWKFDGLVMSDWWGTYSTSEAINAGLDLEMPGPAIWRGKQLISAVECRKVSMQAVDTAVKNVLKLVDRTYKPTAPRENEAGDTEKSRALTRKVAAESIVLLKNQRCILPLAKGSNQTFGLIGEHFKIAATCGGGSSEVTPFYVSTPFDAITEVLGADKIQYQPGCYCELLGPQRTLAPKHELTFPARRWTPLITSGLTLPKSSEPGLLLEWFGEDPSRVTDTPCIHSTTTLSTSMYFSQMIFETMAGTHFIRIKTVFTAEATCKYRFALSVCGKAKLFINAREVIDLWKDQPKKTSDTPCFNKLSMERLVDLDVEYGQKYDIIIIMTNETGKPRIGPTPPGGVRLGGQELRDEDQAISEAVEVARNVDIPIVLAGLSSDYEYEASDRTSLKLPGQMDEMIQRVTEANPNTVSFLSFRREIGLKYSTGCHHSSWNAFRDAVDKGHEYPCSYLAWRPGDRTCNR